jgi:hypothetical protein
VTGVQTCALPISEIISPYTIPALTFDYITHSIKSFVECQGVVGDEGIGQILTLYFSAYSKHRWNFTL